MPKRRMKKSGTKGRSKKPGKAWYQKKYSVGEIAGKAFSTAKYLATLVNVEEKLIDSGAVAVPNTSFTTTGIVYFLTGVAQGSDYNTRNGNSIKTSYYNLGITLACGTQATFIRVILVRDRENRGATPSITDVLETVAPTAHYNHNNLRRFTVLHDSLTYLNSAVPQRTIEISKADKTHLYYQGTTSAVASADENAQFLIMLSDQASGVAAPNAVYNYRLGFVDN